MKKFINVKSLVIVIALFFVQGDQTSAHCDSMDGPVIKALINALESGNVNFALVWVHAEHEEEVRTLFDKVIKVRKLGPDAKELADLYFFESVVRIHRLGEGESYTGLKPAGYDPGEGIRLADHSVETGLLDEVLSIVPGQHHNKLIELFDDLLAHKKYDINDVDAGRAYVESYVQYIHFVEHLLDDKGETKHKHHHH